MIRPLALSGAVAVLATAVSGTTLPPTTTAQMIRDADRIVCAECESVEARLDPRTGIVFTYVRLRLLEDLKGGGEASIALRLAGGEVDGVRTVVPGMPRWRQGEECVVFLGTRNRDGFPVLFHAGRGRIPLRTDDEGRRTLGARVSGLGEISGRHGVRLVDFRGAVRRVLEEQKREAAARAENDR